MFLALLLPVLLTSIAIFFALLAYTGWVFFGVDWQAKRKKQDVESPVGGLQAGGLHAVSSTQFLLDPSKQYSLLWENIKKEVTGVNGSGPKTILHGVSGAAAPGELVALCGPSGAGKSTLLDVLAGRLRFTSGRILVGGKMAKPTFFRSIASYVPQESMFVPTLTVWETLELKMNLKIPRKMEREEKEELMTGILSSMGLSKVKHSRVGGMLPGGLHLRGLSGGESRRLHIACGIVDAPSILFLDEPTSGLDSFSALVLMQHLQHLATGGRTIVSSIHQPRQGIWDMFNKLVLLSEGYLMYYGPVDEVTYWFNHTLGYSYNVEEQGLPADWLLDLVSISFHNSLHSYGFKTIPQLEEASNKFIQEKLNLPAWNASASMKESSVESGSPGTPNGSVMGSDADPDERRLCGWLPVHSYPTSFWNQLRWLMYRNVLQVLRNPADMAGRVFCNLVLGIMLGLIFMGPNNRKGSKGDPVAALMAIFFSMVAGFFQPLTHISLYISDRQFFVVDAAENLYSPLAYYLSQTIVSLPIITSTGWMLFLTMYGMVDLSHKPEAIAVGMLGTCGLQVVSFQVMVIFVYFLRNQDMVLLALIGNATVTIILSGFVVRLYRMYTIFLWASYIFPARYALQMIMITQWRKTQAQSLLKYWGMTWSLEANIIGLIVLSIVFTAVGYFMAVALKLQRQMRC